MKQTLSSFEQLGNALKDIPLSDPSLFDVLANTYASPIDKKVATEELIAKVNKVLFRLESPGFLFGVDEDKNTYVDYCRSLAAYLLLYPIGDNATRVFHSMVLLLDNMAPSYKQGLHITLKNIENNCPIDHLEYTWENLKLPFSIDEFGALLNKTIVSKKEKEIKYKEVEVEKEVVKEKVIREIVEVGPTEDTTYFGDEDQYTELKSSFMEKPKDAQYDNQKIEICRKLCGFLNSEGGVLYIGVDPITKKAYPKFNGTEYCGVERDIQEWLRSTTIYHRPINDMESYCRFVKKQIHTIFESSNPDTISLFINQCVHVGPSKNDNVAKITVNPSYYCVVYLNGAAYLRDGEECREMKQEEILVRSQNLRIISKGVRFEDQLRKAIKDKKQAILYGYQSANSNLISDRHVEPYAFVCNGESVLCYDLDKKAIRQFKLSRISNVRIEKVEWKYENEHLAAKTDIFDWTDMGQQYEICFDMNLKAMTSIIDNYSNAKPELFKSIANGVWRLETIVYSLEPAKRFYLSMADNIVIQETKDSAELKKAITDFVLEHAVLV